MLWCSYAVSYVPKPAASPIIDRLLIHQFHPSSLGSYCPQWVAMKKIPQDCRLLVISCNYMQHTTSKILCWREAAMQKKLGGIFSETCSDDNSIRFKVFSPSISDRKTGHESDNKKRCHRKTPIRRPTWSSFACLITLLEPHECKQQTTHEMKIKWFEIVSRKHGWVNTIKSVHGKKQHRSRATEGTQWK